MPFTVQNVLELSVMQPAEVHTAKDSLSERTVEWVSVIEMPVENFVRKNELVLTTAIGCGQNPDDFMRFVTDVYESEASALIVATGRHIFQIPDKVKHYAEERAFPIIEIPWNVRFSDVTHGVLNELNHWKQAMVKHSEEIQQQLLNLILKGAGLSPIAEAVSRKIESPVIIVDKRGTILGRSRKSKSLVEHWMHVSLSQFKPVLKPSHKTTSALQTEVRSLTEDQHTILQFLIRSSSTVQGYLLFTLPQGKTIQTFLENERVHVLEHAATAAALWFLRENAVHETEMRLKDDFVLSLARGEAEPWDRQLSRAKSLGYDITLPYVCLLAIPENMKDIYRKMKPETESYDHWYQETVHHIEEQFRHAGNEIKRKTMSTFQTDHFILYLEVSPHQPSATIRQFFEHLDLRLMRTLPGLILSWGIGENHAGVGTFHKSYNAARIALDIGCRQKGAGHQTTYAETGVFRALLSLTKNEEMREITQTTIGPLVEFDQKKGMDLLKTLTTYVRNQCNVSKTARLLNLHRQSLLYRLRKIESLTGRSLNDPDDLFLLDLSTRLWITGVMERSRASSG